MSDVQTSIFISYTRTDSDFVDQLDADLRARGFDTWVDREQLKGGENWAKRIESAIIGCQIMLVVLSPDAVASEWVRREIGYADEAHKNIIPLMRYSVPRVPIIRLQDIQIISFEDSYNEDSYKRGLDSLLFSIAVPPSQPLPVPEKPPTPLLAPQRSTESELVDIQPSPPPPEPDLNELWRKAMSTGNLELREIYFTQIVLHREDFEHGLAAQQLEEVSEHLRPIHIQNFIDQAHDAFEHREWGQAIGAWQALRSLDPDNRDAVQGLKLAYREQALKARHDGNWQEEISTWDAFLKLDSDNATVKQYINIAKQNQQWAELYRNAQQLVTEGLLAPAREVLELLWQPGRARFYGDPADIAPRVGIKVPPDYDATGEIERQQVREIDNARKTAGDIVESAQNAANEIVESAHNTANDLAATAQKTANEIVAQARQKRDAAAEAQKKADRALQIAKEMQKRSVVREIGSFAAIVVFAGTSVLLLRFIGLGLSLLLGWALFAVLAACSGLVAALIVQQIARRLQPEVLRQRDQELRNREQQVAKTKREFEGRERSMTDEKRKLQERESQLAKAEQKQKDKASELLERERKVAEQAIKVQPKPATPARTNDQTGISPLVPEDW